MAIRSKLKMLNFLYKVLVDDREKLISSSFSQDKKPTFKYREVIDPFVRSTPRAEGMMNKQFKKFLQDVDGRGFNFHNMFFVKNGKVVAEANFDPYESDIWSVTHSLCKTVTGIAVGMAIDEGYFKLNDNVYELVKGKTRFYTNSALKRLTVKHLLTMTSGVNFREANIVSTPSWSEAFLSSDFVFAPGERFEYNSMNTYMLAVIIYKTTGKTLMEFLEPRLFEPLGINNIAWEKGPEGIEKAGWGMYVTIEELAKFGQFVLQMGVWNIDGQRTRLVSRAWMQDMLKPHVKTSHIEAYGYQIWVDAESKYYCFSGLFGQTVYVNPEYNFVAVFTSGNDNVFSSGSLIEAITDNFCMPMTQLSEEEDVSTSELAEMLQSLVFYKTPLLSPVVIKTEAPVPKQTFKQKFLSNVKRVFRQQQESGPEPIVTVEYPLPDVIQKILQRKYTFKDNNVGLLPVMMQMMNNNFAPGIKEISFYEDDGTLYIHWVDALSIMDIPIGLYKPLKQNVELNGEQYVISSYGYVTRDEDNNVVLKVTVCFLETSSVRYLKCFFIDEDQILKLELDERPSISYISNNLIEQISASELPGFLAKDNGYVRYLVDRLTQPVIQGQRTEDIDR